jgi:dihydropyrimidinase
VYDLVITDAKIVSPDGVLEGSIAVRDGVIEAIGLGLGALPARRTLRAEGRHVLPGLIDVHVHFAMPFMDAVTANDFFTGTTAAAFGGTTTIIDFATQRPGEPLTGTIARRRKDADGEVVIDYALHAIVTDGSRASIATIPHLAEMGSPSLKVYTIYKKAGVMLEDDAVFSVLEAAATSGVMPMVHCENSAITEMLVERFLADNRQEAIYHARSRPNLVEAEAIHRVLFLAKAAKSAAYVVHMSSGEGAHLIAQARRAGLPAYAETCPHYLVLTEETYHRPDGYLWIMSPPLRKPADQDALWQGLRDGSAVQVVATDDGSWSRADKEAGRASFATVPNGIPGVEFRLPLVLSEGVHKGRLEMKDVARICSTAPARIFGLYPRKGAIRPGSDADLVVVDPDANTTISTARLHGKEGWCPYDAHVVKGLPVATVARGEVIVENGAFKGAKGRGRFIERRIDRNVLTSPASS